MDCKVELASLMFSHLPILVNQASVRGWPDNYKNGMHCSTENVCVLIKQLPSLFE